MSFAILIAAYLGLSTLGIVIAALGVRVQRGCRHCVHCGYDLRYHDEASAVCPECGSPAGKEGDRVVVRRSGILLAIGLALLVSAPLILLLMFLG